MRLETEPQVQVNPSRAAETEPAKAPTPAKNGVGFAEERRGERAIVSSFVHVIQNIRDVYAERQIVLVAAATEAWTAHHHRRAAAAALPTASLSSAGWSAATAAAALCPPGLSAATSALILSLPLASRVLRALCALLSAGKPGEVIRRRAKAERSRNAQVHAHRAWALPEIPRNYDVPRPRDWIERAEAGHYRSRIAWIGKRRPVRKLIVAVVITTGDNIERSPAPYAKVWGKADCPWNREIGDQVELVADIERRPAIFS